MIHPAGLPSKLRHTASPGGLQQEEVAVELRVSAPRCRAASLHGKSVHGAPSLLHIFCTYACMRVCTALQSCAPCSEACVGCPYPRGPPPLPRPRAGAGRQSAQPPAPLTLRARSHVTIALEAQLVAALCARSGLVQPIRSITSGTLQVLAARQAVGPAPAGLAGPPQAARAHVDKAQGALLAYAACRGCGSTQRLAAAFPGGCPGSVPSPGWSPGTPARPYPRHRSTGSPGCFAESCTAGQRSRAAA